MDEKTTSEGHDPASASGSASRDLDSIQENAPQSTNVADHNDPTLDRSGSPSETANEPQVTLPSEQDTTSPPFQYFEDAEYFEHVQFFKDVRQNTWILADRGYSGCLDGPSAVGTSGIASCVGMYVEPRPDEFFLWHIQCDPLRKERDNNQKLRNSERRLVARRFQEVLGEYIEGEIDVDLVKSTLVLTSSCPDDQSYAIVDGVLSWAGFGAEQAERWKEEQYGDASAFIVKTPGSGSLEASGLVYVDWEDIGDETSEQEWLMDRLASAHDRPFWWSCLLQGTQGLDFVEPESVGEAEQP